MVLQDILQECKSNTFKEILNDTMHAFRITNKLLFECNTDIKLVKIRTYPIFNKKENKIFGSRIANMVGGHVQFSFENRFINFIENVVDFDLFYNNLLDHIGSLSASNDLIFESDIKEIEWNKNKYFIQFDFKLLNKNTDSIQSSLILAIDELTSLYFN